MEWVLIPLTILGGLLGVYLHEKREYRYLKVLAARSPVSDDEVTDRFFQGHEVPRDIPGRVRQVFAELMNYPADFMLPDDDLSFYWDELDGAELIVPLEQEFGVSITREDVSKLKGVTIRAFTELVVHKMPA